MEAALIEVKQYILSKVSTCNTNPIYLYISFPTVGHHHAEASRSASVEMLKFTPRGSYDQHAAASENSTDLRHIPGATHFMQNPIYGKHDPLSLSREAEYPQNGVIPDLGISAYDALTLPNDKTGSYKRGRANTAFMASNLSPANIQQCDSQSATGIQQYTSQSEVHTHKHSNGYANGHREVQDMCYHDNDHFESTESSSGSSLVHIIPEPDTDRSYDRRVSQALQSIDDAVAGYSGVPVPPPLPPSFLPPPDHAASLQVKRLNWETHNPDEIDKTVWGQWKTTDQLDIEVMVEYLELPQQFSTVKKASPAKQEKAVRRKILHDKKAFNTSIVLASVNIPNVSSSQERDEFIEKALLNVEIQTDEGAEGIITPHLLEQLLQYAPDQDERISETMDQLSADAKHYAAEDSFQEVMEHFVCSAEDAMQHLKRLQSDTEEQVSRMLVYLGEKAKSADSKTIFSTISTFLAKFDNSHRLYVRKIEADLLSPRSPGSDVSQFIGGLSS
ncbi:GRID2IP [Bugula neritina]|uniref:GRID2IP n=1 Tax=Bugula neritina TaxID=10212 RepID=A0A7J7IT57_BUGNE|nr:GRID2IP [Bugula neritina]